MKCQNCHRTVTKKSKFCPNCGQRIVPRTASRPAPQKSKMPIGYAVSLVAFGIAIGMLILKFSTEPGSSTPPPSNLAGQFGATNVTVADIAEGLKCACGTCEHLLNECDCEHPAGALEVKGVIRQKIGEGHKKPHILEMLFAKYPGLKS